MSDIAKVKLLGPATVKINDVEVGHVDGEGVTCSLASELVEGKVGAYGESVVQEWLNGQTVEVEFNLAESNMASLGLLVPGATTVTSIGGDKKLTFGRGAGFQLVPVVLLIEPRNAALKPGFNLRSGRAVPVGDFDIVFNGEQTVYACKFSALIDEAGAADGAYLLDFGDHSITADVVAPSRSTVVPADAAPNIPIDSAVIHTISKALNGGTVNPATVLLVEDPGGTEAIVPGTVVLVNNGVSTTITFTPDDVLKNSTVYLAILVGGAEGGIKDLAGNNLPFYGSEFTTVAL